MVTTEYWNLIKFLVAVKLDDFFQMNGSGGEFDNLLSSKTHSFSNACTKEYSMILLRRI